MAPPRARFPVWAVGFGVLLGLADRWQVERWLAERGVTRAYDESELARDRAALDDELGVLE